MTTGRINQVAAASARGVQPGAAPQEPPLSVPTNVGRGEAGVGAAAARWGAVAQPSDQPRGDP